MIWLEISVFAPFRSEFHWEIGCSWREFSSSTLNLMRTVEKSSFVDWIDLQLDLGLCILLISSLFLRSEQPSAVLATSFSIFDSKFRLSLVENRLNSRDLNWLLLSFSRSGCGFGWGYKIKTKCTPHLHEGEVERLDAHLILTSIQEKRRKFHESLSLF